MSKKIEPGQRRETFSVRLSPVTRALLERLAQTLGISKAAVIEMSVRKLAKKELESEDKT